MPKCHFSTARNTVGDLQGVLSSPKDSWEVGGAALSESEEGKRGRDHGEYNAAILLTQYSQDQYIFEAIEAGVRGMF